MARFIQLHMSADGWASWSSEEFRSTASLRDISIQIVDLLGPIVEAIPVASDQQTKDRFFKFEPKNQRWSLKLSESDGIDMYLTYASGHEADEHINLAVRLYDPEMDVEAIEKQIWSALARRALVRTRG